MINLVTGGAGLLGSHLIRKLLKNGEHVICLDNFTTGSIRNIEEFLDNKNFKLMETDVSKNIDLSVNKIWHLANPASPKYYTQFPILTSNICYLGTNNMLQLATKNKAKFLYASSSEIYGIQSEAPLKENMSPNINHLSQRACYSLSKLLSENLCFNYKRKFGLDIKIARIFNTYGPKSFVNDGRVIPSFIESSLSNSQLIINGNGKQTRSFCYVDDLVEGLISLMDSFLEEPVNLGNCHEITILELAKKISNKLNNQNNFIYVPIDPNESLTRRPCIKKAMKYLNWKPKIELDKGLDLTIDFYLRNKKNLRL